MEKLIVTKQFVYKGKQYIPGEEVPGNDEEIVEAWKRAGSVRVEKKEQEEASCDVATGLKDSVYERAEEHVQRSKVSTEQSVLEDTEQTVEMPKEGKRKK